MHEFWNLTKGHAAHSQMMFGQNQWGVVSDVRATDQGYDVRAIIQPDGIGSAWMPVLTAFGGAGWGMVARPSVGMQVLIASDSGDGHHGIVVGMAWSTQATPPKPPNGFQQQAGTEVGDGEWCVVSKAGTVVRLCANGEVYIKAPNVNIEGNLIVLGDITARGSMFALKDPNGAGGNVTAQMDLVAGQDMRSGRNVSDVHGTMDAIRVIYNNHGHPNNGVPAPQIPE